MRFIRKFLVSFCFSVLGIIVIIFIGVIFYPIFQILEYLIHDMEINWSSILSDAINNTSIKFNIPKILLMGFIISVLAMIRMYWFTWSKKKNSKP